VDPKAGRKGGWICLLPPPRQKKQLNTPRYTLRTGEFWYRLFDITNLDNLGLETDPFLIVHRAVAVLDRLMALSKLPQYCAVSAARLPLMAVACLRIAGGERARDALSLSFLNRVCGNRYSEAIITAMENLLTAILNVVVEKETQQPPPHHKVDGEAMVGEEEREQEDNALTSRDWIGLLMKQSRDERGLELSGGGDDDSLTMEYANFLSDLFLQEGTALSLSLPFAASERCGAIVSQIFYDKSIL